MASLEDNEPQTGPAGVIADRDWEARAFRHLRASFPAQTAELADDELRQRWRSWDERSRRYGLKSGEQVLCFAMSAFLLGENFDSDPKQVWAAEILRDPEIPADERAAMVVALAELLIEDEQEESTGYGESR
jgi:hypothetical protein